MIGNFTTANDWLLVLARTPIQIDSNCFAPYPILGGYNNLVADNCIFTNLSSNFPHYQVSVRIQLYIFGQYFYGFLISIDGNTCYNQAIDSAAYESFLQGKQCNTLSLANVQIYSNMSHNQNSSQSVNSSVEIGFNNGVPVSMYWGISTFVVNFHVCHYTCSFCIGPDENQCTSCLNNATLNGSNYCVCNSGYVLYSNNYSYYCQNYPCAYCCAVSDYFENNSCKSCNSSCLTCQGTAINCTSCSPIIILPIYAKHVILLV